MDSPLVYTRNAYVDSAHADRYGNLRPSALLEIMQEVAGEHAARLGLGRAPLLEKNLFWAVVRQSLEISRMPQIGETMIVETWPAPPSRTAFPRHMVGRTEDGEVLFRAVTLWLFMNVTTRAMVLPAASGLDCPGIVRGGELPNPPGIVPKEFANQEIRRVRYSELDCNGHMSNTKYLNWMDDLLPSEYHKAHNLRKLHICYLSEALEDQEIHLRWALEEGNLTLEAKRTEGEKESRVFAIKAQFA